MIDTERLILRGWRDADAAPFHAMGQDPAMMRFIGPPPGPEAAAAAAAARQNALLAAHGRCFWPLEERADGAFVGFCGVKPGADGTSVAGQAKIGWRPAHARWGRGYAAEAARAALAWMWARTAAPSVAAITVVANARSRRLMERLGMTHDPAEDFDRPALAPGDPLRRHVVYRIARPAGA